MQSCAYLLASLSSTVNGLMLSAWLATNPDYFVQSNSKSQLCLCVTTSGTPPSLNIDGTVQAPQPFINGVPPIFF